MSPTQYFENVETTATKKGIAEMVRLPLTGGCNCGAVRFEVTEPSRALGRANAVCTVSSRRSSGPSQAGVDSPA